MIGKRYHNAFGHGQGLIAEKKIKKGPDPKGIGRGQQGRGVCVECGADVTLRKAQPYQIAWNVRTGDLVCGSHRVGGGGYSLRRGDAICQGVGRPPKRGTGPRPEKRS